MAPRKKSAPVKKTKAATRSASVSTRSSRRNKSAPAKKATATSSRSKTPVKKKSPRFIPEAPPVVPGDEVLSLELAITSITLNPDPPVHDEGFTVTVVYTPVDAALTVEVWVNGTRRSSKAAMARVARFSPAELGNPSAGDSGQVKATISHPAFPADVSSTRNFTFA
jgi:hypothetical protein